MEYLITWFNCWEQLTVKEILEDAWRLSQPDGSGVIDDVIEAIETLLSSNELDPVFLACVGLRADSNDEWEPRSLLTAILKAVKNGRDGHPLEEGQSVV
jgi:hypothetical protein